MLWLLLFSCAHGDAAKARVAPPRVPSLHSPNYVHVAVRPSDPVVARLWPGPVDESLAGAAGAVAIRLAEGRDVGPAELRWRAILAGYPWPVTVARFVTVPQDGVADALVAEAQAHADRDVGLVRARGNDGDHWVLLVGERRTEGPPIPREPALGQELSFPGLEYAAVTPRGAALAGRDSLRVTEAGEWLVQLRDAQGVVATFPLYVGRTTPQTSPFSADLGAGSAGDLDEELLLQLDALDLWYDRPAAERDPALDAVARGRVRTFLRRGTVPDAGRQLAAAGYFGGTSGECHAGTVSECLDAMWWSVSGHAALAGAWGTIGMAVEPTDDGVGVAVAVADRSGLPAGP